MYITIIIIFIIFVIYILYHKKEHFIIKPSKIQGVGLYSDKNYNPNTLLFTAIDKNKIVTYLGSKINHCNNPNTYLIKENNIWNVYSKIHINQGTELTINYNNTPHFIKKPNPEWKC